VNLFFKRALSLMKQVRHWIFIVLAATSWAAASCASAHEAFTSRAVNVRAGPDRGYPLVAWLPTGTVVYVNGCISDYRWCDITAGFHRGWVYARFLELPYLDRRLPIYGNGALFVLPIITFSVGVYWDDYYRDRPWYRDRPYWHDWHPSYRPPPLPRPQPPIVRPRPPVSEPRPNPPRTVRPPRQPVTERAAPPSSSPQPIPVPKRP
jgi:uncharacterized protein YraI